MVTEHINQQQENDGKRIKLEEEDRLQFEKLKCEEDSNSAKSFHEQNGERPGASTNENVGTT